MYGQPTMPVAQAIAQPMMAVAQAQPMMAVAQPQPQQPAAFFGANQSALQAWFQQVDKDRTGRIDVAELQAALQQGGLNYSRKMVVSFVRMFDVSNTHKLDFNEFGALQAYLAQVQAAFQQQGPALVVGQSSPTIGLMQVQQALAALGYQLDMAPSGAFYKLCESFDFDQTGRIGVDAFLAMVTQVKNSRKFFDMFDAQRTGQATLDFNQLTWLISQL